MSMKESMIYQDIILREAMSFDARSSRKVQSRSLDIETRDVDSHYSALCTLKVHQYGDICSNASE